MSLALGLLGTPSPVGTATPTVTATLLASCACGQFEGCGINGAANDHDTVMAGYEEALLGGALVRAWRRCC